MRQIIIIDAKRVRQFVATGPDGDTAENITLRVAFWFPVNAGSEVPVPPEQPATKVPDATAPEIEALRAGSIIEDVQTVVLPQDSTKAQVKAGLVNAYTTRATQRAQRMSLAQFIGTSYENGTWTGA